MPDLNTNWTDAHTANWAQWLAPFRAAAPDGLEIGCFEGRSTLWFLEHIATHPDSRVTVVDTFTGGADQIEHGVDCSDLFGRFCRRIRGYEQRVRVLRGESRFALPRLVLDGDRFDWVYVDGSHEAPDVLRDSVHALDLLRPGGVIIWDDWSWMVAEERWRRPRTAILGALSCLSGAEWECLSHPELNAFLRIPDLAMWHEFARFGGAQLALQRKE